MKKKRVETFRNIRYGDGRIYYHYTDSAAAVSPPVGLAQARPNNTYVLVPGWPTLCANVKPA